MTSETISSPSSIVPLYREIKYLPAPLTAGQEMVWVFLSALGVTVISETPGVIKSVEPYVPTNDSSLKPSTAHDAKSVVAPNRATAHSLGSVIK